MTPVPTVLGFIGSPTCSETGFWICSNKTLTPKISICKCSALGAVKLDIHCTCGSLRKKSTFVLRVQLLIKSTNPSSNKLISISLQLQQGSRRVIEPRPPFSIILLLQRNAASSPVLLAKISSDGAAREAGRIAQSSSTHPKLLRS